MIWGHFCRKIPDGNFRGRSGEDLFWLSSPDGLEEELGLGEVFAKS